MRLSAFLAVLLLALPALAGEPAPTVLTVAPATGRMDKEATLTATVGIGFSTAVPKPGKLSAGSTHSCAVTAAGGVRCWGDNLSGQIGDGTTVARSLPVAVKGVGGTGTLAGVKAVVTGNAHSCALLVDGTVACWGSGGSSKLGSVAGDVSSPIKVPGLSGVTAIAAGHQHTCAIDAAGKVICWGFNEDGQTGQAMGLSVLPTAVPGLTGATAIAAGGLHSCAVLAGGTVSCWGRNTTGQIGMGATSTKEPSPVPVLGLGGSGVLSGATAIAAGRYNTCAVLAGGKVACWGDNGYAQLGDGSGNGSPFPVAVKGPGGTGELSGMASVMLGRYYGCATAAAGAASCWGLGEFGQLGSVSLAGVEPYPVAVTGLPAAISSLATGDAHACAILADGQLSCWGYRGEVGVARLGDGVVGQQPLPAPVIAAGSPLGGSTVASGSDFTCAIVSGGVRCWGRGPRGALGNGGGKPDSTEPVTVSLNGTPLSGIVEVVAGDAHACARRDDGTVYCWGTNSFGQLGTGNAAGIQAPGIVTLGGPATRLAAGASHSCAILDGGIAKCWGLNSAGQLGDNTKMDAPTPVPVSDLDGVTVTGITAGSSHTCARVTAGAAVGSVRCWGSNAQGQIGNAGVMESLKPVQTDVLDGMNVQVASISAGRNHTCAVIKGGTVQCWGAGGNGQIGQGSYQNAASPVAVTGLSTVATIDAGGDNSCARLTTGALRCWGSNEKGQLGTGGYLYSNIPVAVLAASGAELDVAAVSAGGLHTCAVATTGGALSCWGSRSNGQLGDGVLGYAATPVPVAKAEGTVTFRDKGKAIGTATLVNGVATLKKKLAAGLHSLTASYAGGPVFAAATSKAISHLVTGTPGADTITGTSAGDTLKGMGGADRITGASGDDVIEGGSGNDVLTGGSGRDRLIGGTGKDRFVFRRASDSTPTRPDTVTDFRAGDRIDLSAFDTQPRSKKINRFKVYIGKRKFTGRAGEVRFDARRHRLEGDVNGDRRADFRVLLSGVKSLSASAVKLR
jgi:alpha-tubulin suppressor-like RCC1 family protein